MQLLAEVSQVAGTKSSIGRISGEPCGLADFKIVVVGQQQGRPKYMFTCQTECGHDQRDLQEVISLGGGGLLVKYAYAYAYIYLYI